MARFTNDCIRQYVKEFSDHIEDETVRDWLIDEATPDDPHFPDHFGECISAWSVAKDCFSRAMMDYINHYSKTLLE